MNYRVMLAVASTLGASAFTLPAYADSDVDELRAIVNAQQDQIDALQSQVGAGSNSNGSSRTHIGGYGELHYNNLDNQREGGSDKKEIDFHRFVLFFSHEFNDRIRFNSELELEHSLSGDGKPGEVELEQAYIDFDLNDNNTVRGGLFLLPVGILNETHEPETFYGTERNPVEKNIIPTTWWEAGAGMHGSFIPGLSYDLAITSGLNDDGYNIRAGRQKVAKAKAEDLAYTGRLKWTGIAGLELAATVQYQENITQSTDPDASATLFETHAVWQRGPFGLRALYATWNVDGEGAKSVGKDEQTGYYIEPSFKFSERLGVFARYNQWDNAAGDDSDSEYSQVDVGINFWPHEQVVIKADYQDQDAPEGSNEFDGFNLGIGYHF